MRLHRILGAGLLTVALASLNASPVAAATPTSGVDRALVQTVAAARHADGVTYSATASAATTEHYDARRSNDIVSTSMRFDTNLINVTIETQGNMALDDVNWAAVDFSFNKSGAFDGTVIAGKPDPALTEPIVVAINRFGSECNAMQHSAGQKLTLSVDATCMGHPGAVSYRAMFGNFLASANGDAEAVDYSPSDGSFTAPVSERGGYWLLGADGGVFSFGDAQFFGSTGSLRLNKPVVAMSAQPRSDGYRFVASDGGVFAFGNSGFYGSMGGKALNAPVVSMATTASGNGYWLVASDGGIFAFGDAAFLGSTGSLKLNKPIVGMAPSKTGRGYWLVASDGGVFAFGDARFYGSTGGQSLSQPITAMSSTTTGNGYRMLAADGGVFAFGDASYLGSGVGRVLAPTMAMTNQANGYLIADQVGGVYEIGPVFHFGDLVDLGITPNQPIVGMTVVPE